MTRALLTYFNSSTSGEGLEGLINFSNNASNNLLIPLFLFVFYSAMIYVASKNEYKLGGQVLLISFAFFILTMIAQTFATFNQMVLFIFAIGMIVGLVISIVENSN
ncbi:MAG: hypothetical protein M0R17_09490 [Candidatus Omnitrophica bacterium]|jgi:hypothetical protein|nr:hypothetical protein [Candidatus Omnitrophota bacterium]